MTEVICFLKRQKNSASRYLLVQASKSTGL